MKIFHENDDEIKSLEIKEKVVESHSNDLRTHYTLYTRTNFQFDNEIFLVPIDEICL